MILVQLDAFYTVEELQYEFNYKKNDHYGMYGHMCPLILVNDGYASSRLLEFYNSVIIGMIYGNFGS